MAVQDSILALKAAYEQRKAAGASQSELDDIHKQADNFRAQNGISDSDQVYGNNNGVDPVKQNQMTQAMMAARSQQPVATTTAQPSANNTAQDYIDKLNAAKQQASIAALGKSRDAALSNLSQERSAIQPKYYDAKNQVAAGAQQQARNFAEYMANRGGSSSGANAQATLVNNMATQGNLGTLGRQEAQAYTDIGRRTTDVNNAYQSDIASTVLGGEADKMQALLNDYYQQQQRELQIAGLTGLYNDKLTLAGKQFEQGVNVDNRNFNYQTGRDQVLDSRYNQQFDYQKARDSITDERYKAEFDFNVKKYGQDYALQKAQLDGQLANQANDNELQRLRYTAEQNPNSLENQYKQAQIDALNNKTNSPDVAATMKQLESQYVQYDNTGNPSVTNPYAMRNSIIALGLPDGETIKLLNKYNLPIQATNYAGGR